MVRFDKSLKVVVLILAVLTLLVSVSTCLAADMDGDGIGDELDNCPTIYNAAQTDTNGDGVGDVCTAYYCVRNSTELHEVLTASQTDDRYDYIMVEQGTYQADAGNSFGYYSQQLYGLTLAGGYTDGCSSREVNPHNTILFDGSKSLVVLAISNATLTLDSPVSRIAVEGMTLQSGYKGAQISAGKGEIVFSHDAIADNQSLSGLYPWCAGAQLDSATKIVVTGNSIGENQASDYGGGICLRDAADIVMSGNTLVRNWVLDNLASGYTSGDTGGGGVFIKGGNLLISDNVIALNTNSTKDPGYGGGIYADSQYLTVVNNTIYGNDAKTSGGGIYYAGSGVINMYNNIIRGNTAQDYGDIKASSGITGGNIFNNDYDPSNTLIPAAVVQGDNINAAPVFVDVVAGDYHLIWTSPDRNMGANSAPDLPSEDIEEMPRIAEGIVDIGAYEYSPVRVSFTADALKGLVPFTVNFTDQSRSIWGPAVSWAWDFDNDGIVDSTDKNPSFTYVNAGSYTVRLTVADSSGVTNNLVRKEYIKAGDTTDSDMDGVPDVFDNCINSYNPTQTDLDADGIGDACDHYVGALTEVLYITDLKKKTDPDPGRPDVIGMMTDQDLSYGYRVQHYRGRYEILSFRSDNDSSKISSFVLNVYASNLYRSAPQKAIVYAYAADGMSVQTSESLDFTLSSGWNSLDLTPLLHSMDGHGFVKFRLAPSGKYFDISEAYLVELVDDREIDVAPSRLDFGPVDMGASKTLDLTVSNGGTGNLKILGVIMPPDPFSLESDECTGVTLSPGGICRLAAGFTQSAPGTYFGTLQILSDDEDNPDARVRLTSVPQPANLTGTVTDGLHPLAGVMVTLTDAVGTYFVFTGKGPDGLPDGKFSLNNLTAGSFTATFESSGYPGKTVTGVLQAGENTLDVQLTPVPALHAEIASPGEGDVLNSSPVTVSGSVNNDAQVTVNGIQATLGNGRFSASISLHEGLNTITVLATDQYGQSVSQSIEVNLVTKGSVSGTVTDSSSGMPLPLATVSATDSSGAAYTVVTTADGRFSLTGISQGAFIGIITKDGYGAYPLSGTVTAGQTLTLDVSLDPILPVIGDTAATNITMDSAVITWTTDQPTDSTVEYGTTTSYGSRTSDAAMVTSHSVLLANLTPGVTYHFNVKSANTYGLLSSSGDSVFTTSLFQTTSLGDYGNVTVMEVQGNYDSKMADGSLNYLPRQDIAKEFIKNHTDDYDFIVIFTDFDFPMPETGAKGYYLEVSNGVKGIGKTIFDDSSYYGSNGRLQGIIEMGNIIGRFSGPGDPKFEETLNTLAHEQMHRWGAAAEFRDSSGTLSSALLGRDGSHWSYLLDSDGSVLYGNDWQDNGDGTFTSTGQARYYSALDLYMAGFYDKSQVSPMLLIDNPSLDPVKLPEAGATVTGTAETVTIDDIIAAEGDRVPDASTSQKSFRTAFILITRPGTFTGNELPQIEDLRNAWAGRFAELTGGRGSIADVAPGTSITLSSPSEGDTITGPDVTVKGSIINSTGNETGVTVNGVVATVDGTQFIASHVPLVEGSNTITVTASDTAGTTATTSITVNDVTGNYIRLSSNVESGISPLEVTLRIDGSFSIENSNISVTGPAAIEPIDNPSPAEYTIKINTEGTYYFTASVTGPDGNTYEDTLAITVMNKEQLDRLLKAKWEGMKGALVAGDIEKSLSFFSERSSDIYRAIFEGMSLDDINAVFSTIVDLQVDAAYGNFAECGAIRVETDDVYSYPVAFVKNENGIWVIVGF